MESKVIVDCLNGNEEHGDFGPPQKQWKVTYPLTTSTAMESKTSFNRLNSFPQLTLVKRPQGLQLIFAYALESAKTLIKND